MKTTKKENNGRKEGAKRHGSGASQCQKERKLRIWLQTWAKSSWKPLKTLKESQWNIDIEPEKQWQQGNGMGRQCGLLCQSNEDILMRRRRREEEEWKCGASCGSAWAWEDKAYYSALIYQLWSPIMAWGDLAGRGRLKTEAVAMACKTERKHVYSHYSGK